MSSAGSRRPDISSLFEMHLEQPFTLNMVLLGRWSAVVNLTQSPGNTITAWITRDGRHVCSPETTGLRWPL